jgi:putative salt-induced outer membrane protein YdiY
MSKVISQILAGSIAALIINPNEALSVAAPWLADASQSETVPIEPATQPAAPPEWKFKLVVAAAGASGNTENGTMSALLAGVRETPRLKTSFDAGYFYGQSDGDRSQNRFTVGGRNDWLNPDSKWFYFADIRYDVDEFQSWDSRINGHVGIGYRLIQPPKLTLNLLAGVGAVKEFGSDNEDVRPEALLGIEGQYDFSEKHSIKFDSTVYPDLSDLGEYRWVSNFGWSYLLDQEDRLSLTAGVQHEYQSQVDPGRHHSDVRFFAGLQLDF